LSDDLLLRLIYYPCPSFSQNVQICCFVQLDTCARSYPKSVLRASTEQGTQVDRPFTGAFGLPQFGPDTGTGTTTSSSQASGTTTSGAPHPTSTTITGSDITSDLSEALISFSPISSD